MVSAHEHDCECNPAYPGILWPWGADGEYPPALPYVERCDMCGRYPTDEAAAKALAGRYLPLVGLTEPLIGQHRVYKGKTPARRSLRRVMWYVFPSVAAVWATADEDPPWHVRVENAKGSLHGLHASMPEELPEAPVGAGA